MERKSKIQITFHRVTPNGEKSKIQIIFHRMTPNGEKSKIQIHYLPQDDPEWREE